MTGHYGNSHKLKPSLMHITSNQTIHKRNQINKTQLIQNLNDKTEYQTNATVSHLNFIEGSRSQSRERGVSPSPSNVYAITKVHSPTSMTIGGPRRQRNKLPVRPQSYAGHRSRKSKTIMTTIENNDYEDAVTGSLKLNQNSQRFPQKEGENPNANVRRAMPPPRYKIMRAGSSNPRKEKLNQSFTAE